MIPAMANLVAATMMTGVIWFVQVVHYPLFSKVGPEQSIDYARDNQRRTSFVVGPPMAVEGLASIWLFVDPPAGLSRILPTVSGLLLAVVLISTVLVQVPRHARLAEADDARSIAEVVAGLVAGNWVRTIGWSARCAIAVAMVARLT
ncbi:MAG: hypothetical protein O2925_08945 [Actinomycetota bacterium]|jgi:hypothetical protein|nr:hypothetical protein [Actinomycetota bacterium]MDA3014651.1 hypothetical protein [Actinomycetota bacterium]MDA3028913.1 hypothetical protein [Actinomycetota bacterium]